jgi:predicted Ser/Thr protein kinase
VDALGPGDPRQVGPYTLLGRLGEGGMGRVFLGTSPGGPQVAVKVLHPGHAARPQFRSRFAREARAARRVSARYTAQVVDADPDGDPPWLATAYIAGPSLKGAVAGHGPLGEARALRLGAQLAEGLAAIHAAGLIHRDLKPANIILAEDGARIIDFGVARILEASMLTTPGALVGTYAFMSPEQIRAEPAGPESDVFSLGSVLAFAATGHGPFDAPYPAILARVLHDPPRLEDVPDGQLRAVITACLRKAAAERPSLAGLAGLLAPRAGRPAGPGPRASRRPPAAGPPAGRGLPLDAELPAILAGTAARLGHVPRALDLAARVRDDEQRAWALADVACSLAMPRAGAATPSQAGLAREGAAEAAATARAAAGAGRASGQRAGDDDAARVAVALRMCFGGHPLARAALALAVTGQRGAAVRLAAGTADPWIRSAAWSAIVASGQGMPADAAAALAAALAVSAAHEQVLALAELALALRGRSPSSAVDAARQAAGAAARSPARLLGLSDLMWPGHARYGTLCREQADRLRGYCQRLPPGPDDEVTALLARSLTQAGLLADADLAAYALSRAGAREAAVGCFTGLVLAEATAGDPDFSSRQGPLQALLAATAERALAGAFLRHGHLAAARWIVAGRAATTAGGDDPGAPPPRADEARERRWLELLADFGPAEHARAACASAADPELPLARLAWRLEAAGPASPGTR